MAPAAITIVLSDLEQVKAAFAAADCVVAERDARIAELEHELTAQQRVHARNLSAASHTLLVSEQRIAILEEAIQNTVGFLSAQVAPSL